MANLYRKTSLERISNPEQLDRAITVSSPMSWLALAGVALILTAVIIWAFTFKIPDVMEVNAISAGDGSWAIYTDKACNSISYTKQKGDDVKKGDIIAIVKTIDGGENEIKSDIDGTVAYTYYSPSETDDDSKDINNINIISVGSEIARITPKSDDTEMFAVCYLSDSQISLIPELSDSASVSENEKIKINIKYNNRIYDDTEIVAKGRFFLNKNFDSLFISGNWFQGSNPGIPLLIKVNSGETIPMGIVLYAEIEYGFHRPIDKLSFVKSDSQGDS